MEKLWTVTQLSSIYNADIRRVQKALATLPPIMVGKRETYDFGAATRLIFADLCGQPPPDPPTEHDSYWQLRHACNVAKEAVESLQLSDTVRGRLQKALETIWQELLRLQSRFED